MLVAVGSVKGSPGVSTLCLALAARWPSFARNVVVECDPAGGDLAARFGLSLTPGLVSLAAQARTHAEPGAVFRHIQVLPGGLPVVVAPPGAEHARAAVSQLSPTALSTNGAGKESTGKNSIKRSFGYQHAPLEDDAKDTGDDVSSVSDVVLADCGRLDPDSAALPIVRAADYLLLLVRPHADELAHLAHRLEQIRSWTPRLRLLLAGEGYPASAVEQELGFPVLATVPCDPVMAAAMRGEPSAITHRLPRRSRHALREAATRIASDLASDALLLPPTARNNAAETTSACLAKVAAL